MTYPSAAHSYRESEVLSAPPGRLLLITFDGLLTAMTRARVGIAMSNHEVTLAALDRSRAFLGELLASLDRTHGGEIAERLASLYVFVFGELLALGMQPNLSRLDRVIGIIRELRDAFAQIASTPKALVA